MNQPHTLPVGTVVRVNCWRATVTRAITDFRHTDPFRGHASLRLTSPLYEVELDFSRKFAWNDKQVFIPQGCKRLKLFSDEFDLLPEWAQPIGTHD